MAPEVEISTFKIITFYYKTMWRHNSIKSRGEFQITAGVSYTPF